MKSIEIPAGYTFNRIEGNQIYLNKIDWQDIRSFDAVLLAANKTREQFDLECQNLEDDEIAFKQLKLIVKVLNQDWTPDFENYNQAKWTLYYYLGNDFRLVSVGCYDACSHSSVRLLLESKEKALHLDEYFKDILKRYLN